MPETQKQKILVIKLGALGDFIQALGPMASVRNHHKDAHITLMTTAPFEKLARAAPYFDEIWIDEKPKLLNIAAWGALKKRLQGGNFSRVYDLQNNDRTAFYFRLLSGSKKPEWVGAAPGASHRNASPDRTAGHAFDGHVQTLALAGIKDVSIDRLEWMQGNISSFAYRKPYVIFVPGSSPDHLHKRWPAEKYGRLAQILHAGGYQIILLGTAAEKSVIDDILRHCPEALDLAGQTDLAQIAALARGAAGAIGNDTGPLHLIAATGCPCLALFSQSSNPVRHAPKGENVTILRRDLLQELEMETVLESFSPRGDNTSLSATRH